MDVINAKDVTNDLMTIQSFIHSSCQISLGLVLVIFMGRREWRVEGTECGRLPELPQNPLLRTTFGSAK
ncbi:MAG: hypothetical protein GX452_03615 [Ignavibacteriales bacterium]|nr:hypothetical protein [Ignavibacteriales bacterium]